MTHFITDIESQTVTLDGRTYTAADCRHRLYEDFCRRYGPDSFHACLAAFLREWFDASDTVCVHTSGSTGTPKELRVEKRRMMASAMMTVNFLGLRRGDAALPVAGREPLAVARSSRPHKVRRRGERRQRQDGNAKIGPIHHVQLLFVLFARDWDAGRHPSI